MELIVGTYEQLILGYRLAVDEDGSTLETSFTDHSHTGCVRTIGVSQRGILASGSSDETIQLFNLNKRREIGSLVHHEGSVMSLCFHAKTHMFSASEDGTIAVWQVGKWECLRTLKGHKGPVYALGVHPSGKLALSAGKDNTLRTWNLMTAKAAYVTNIKHIVDLIQWCPNGDQYVLVSGQNADIYEVKTGTICYSVQTGYRIHSIAFLEPKVMVLAGMGGNIHIYDIVETCLLHKFTTGSNRIRGMACCKCDGSLDSAHLATASSDGKLQLWKLTKTAKTNWEAKLVTEVDTKFRLTCLAMFTSRTSVQKGDAESIVVNMEDVSTEKRIPHAEDEEIAIDEEEVETETTTETVDSERTNTHNKVNQGTRGRERKRKTPNKKNLKRQKFA